ncbi:MAG: fumarate reductase/succinate dehydrogenase flavoprotein subunit, partial [Acidobacteriota bacterium]|nr:fumarate reductase/succinate dehydrogenase flavoprotein subunit [Acidobacteriota bacterium]
GLSDGYFVLPYTIGNYLAGTKTAKLDANHPEFRAAEAGVHELTDKLLSIKGKRTVASFHRALGKLVWDYCGMSRNAEGLQTAIEKIKSLRQDYWSGVLVAGAGEELNQSLEVAGRVADFFELAELMCMDALDRNESAGGHFREEFQTADGEALRDDEHYSYVSAWEYAGDNRAPVLHKELLEFQYVHPSQRSYK